MRNYNFFKLFDLNNSHLLVYVTVMNRDAKFIVLDFSSFYFFSNINKGPKNLLEHYKQVTLQSYIMK